MQLVQVVAEVIVDFILPVSESQLHLPYQERILTAEVDEDVSGGFVELILHS